jgi:hypothetical protein
MLKSILTVVLLLHIIFIVSNPFTRIIAYYHSYISAIHSCCYQQPFKLGNFCGRQHIVRLRARISWVAVRDCWEPSVRVECGVYGVILSLIVLNNITSQNKLYVTTSHVHKIWGLFRMVYKTNQILFLRLWYVRFQTNTSCVYCYQQNVIDLVSPIVAKEVLKVYYGNLTPQIRAVNISSLLSSVIGLASQPFLIQQVPNLGSPTVVTLFGFVYLRHTSLTSYYYKEICYLYTFQF